MVRMAKSWAERIGLNVTSAIMLLGLFCGGVLFVGVVISSLDKQREISAILAALDESVQTEAEARRLLEANLREKSDRIAELHARLQRVEDSSLALKVEIAGTLAKLAADVSNIKERLSGRVSLSVPERAG